LPYFFTTAKHELFRLRRSKHTRHVEFVAEEHGTEAYQLKELMDEERMSVLTDCIQELTPSSREYILYWLKYPDYNAQDVANHFGISLNAAWTRKHRILKVLQACCEKKLAK
jgi:DNA-directed RNA polymerase specialized sigma24 family protein